jgi:hypothetical protein
MKTRYLRITFAGSLVIAAVALGFTAVKISSPPLVGRADIKAPFPNKFRKDFDKMLSNKIAMPGPSIDRGPTAAAEEAYAIRAYPFTDIPFFATLNAQAAFNTVKSRGVGNGKYSTSQWFLIGPSSASFPDILTFSGASYFTSGRITALASMPTCSNNNCRVWAAAAGGGIWRTDNALSGNGASWTFVSGSFGTNAIGALTYDAASSTLYAGTGEPNVSVDSEAGVGIYKSTDGGNNWTKLADLVTNLTTNSPQGPNGTYTGDAFAGRAIQRIAVDPNNSSILFVASARGVRGVSSTDGGPTGNPPTPRPPYGLFKSTDGGATFSFVWDGNFTNRGAIDVAIDPSNSNIIYATALNQGTWRSTDGGTTWGQIKARLTANDPDRPSIAVTLLPNGKTRLYLGEGAAGSPAARVFRTDDAAAASPVFTDLTTSQNIGYCTGQCWYDNVVYTPPGKPDVVYLGGSYDYGNYGFRNNGRAFLYSIDAGASFTDLTWDATTNPTPRGSCCQPNPIAPNGMHPDQHAVIELPGSNAAIFGSDGGLVRSSGQFADISSQCASRPISGTNLALCQQLLSRVSTHLYSMNKGLSTLQFQSVSVAPDNVKHVQGGTQDNGTFETYGGAVVWPQIIYGDGGQSGFSVTNSNLRFNTFSGQGNAANFRNGNSSFWVDISGPYINSPEGSYFYPPIISDPNPANAQTIYQGSFSVWRTQDWGGNQAFLEANCNDFTLSSIPPTCGDFVPLGPTGATDLTDTFAINYGRDRRGGAVAWIARAPSDTGTIWAATGTGRVFVTHNGDAAAGSVTWTRIDTLPSAATVSPGRFITHIYVDPANPNHAWISYSGYNFNTPSQPGHVFEVTYNPATPDATWTNLDGGTGPMGDLPVTAIVRDDNTGDLYAGTDFGVMRLLASSSTWLAAGTGLPNVEICGLTIVPSARVLYAATHGRSAWSLTLP